MQGAEETGHMVATEGLTLFRNPDRPFYRRTGVIWFMPIYLDPPPPQTPQETPPPPSRSPAPSRQRPDGFVTGVVRLEDLLSSTLNPITPQAIQIGLYETDRASTEPDDRYQLLYAYGLDSDDGAQAHFAQPPMWNPRNPDQLSYRYEFKIQGRRYLVTCLPTQAYVTSDQASAAPTALIVGLVLSAVLTAYYAHLMRQSGRVQQLLIVRTDELSRSNQSLQTLAAQRHTSQQEAIKRAEELRERSQMMLSVMEDLEVERTRLAKEIEQRKAAEQQIAEQTAELRRSNEDLEQFAYVASHDLQEPLRMVSSYTQLLADRYKGQFDDRADKYIRYIVEGATRMKQLVQDLLSYARIGRQRIARKPINCTQLVASILDEFKRTINNAKASIECDDLPIVQGDETQLRQVFQNLISNAIKFRADRPPWIKIHGQPDENGWRFSVEDNGIGIEPEYAQRVFLMFQRLHERERYEGNGIGLAIVQKIVDHHGGRVWFESTPGQGTVFYLYPSRRVYGGQP